MGKSSVFLRLSGQSQQDTPVGVLHESLAHDSLKSSLAFRKPATADRPSPAAARPGLTASWSASMGMQASAPAELRAPWAVARWEAEGSATSAPKAERQSLSRRLTVAFCLYRPERRRPADC